MADTLTVRIYNVHFGDAILVTVPDRNPSTGKVTKRRILIDVGNAPVVASPEGGDDAVFKPVVDDILDQLDGQPLDLYVMTHEHLDHVQGLPYAAWKLYPNDFARRFRVDRVWLTASSAPDYYSTHPEAERVAMEDMYARLRSFLALNAVPGHVGLLEILANNDPAKTTQCVDFLRNLNPVKTSYIYRGVSLKGKHSFREAKLEVWAPEEDTSEYYGRFQQLALGENAPHAWGPMPRRRRPPQRPCRIPRPALMWAPSSTSWRHVAAGSSTTCSRSIKRPTTPASCSCWNGAGGASYLPATPKREAG